MPELPRCNLWGGHPSRIREAVATIKHSVKIMAVKENNQRQESTVGKYFDRTADGYKAWAEEDEEERNYLQIATETTGDTDEDGNRGFDFHIAYHGKIALLASGIAQTMEKDEFLRQLIIEAARRFLMNK